MAGVAGSLSTSCETEAIAFASPGGHGGYQSNMATNPNIPGYYSHVGGSPGNIYAAVQNRAAPTFISGASYPGVFTALRSFDLSYTNGVPLSSYIGAGCPTLIYNSTAIPPFASVYILGLLRQGSSGSPPDDFSGRVECFANWGQLGF
jgi:hypothetical protein